MSALLDLSDVDLVSKPQNGLNVLIVSYSGRDRCMASFDIKIKWLGFCRIMLVVPRATRTRHFTSEGIFTKFIWSSFNPKMSRFDPCRDGERVLFANKSLCCVECERCSAYKICPLS